MIPHSKPWLTDDDRRAVDEALRSGMIARGERVASLESATARYLGAAGAVATGSGTAALALALKSLGIGPGDEVVLPTYVCESVADGVRTAGAAPVLCDVGPGWVMTPETVAPAITPRTRAIVAVHVFGIAAPARELRALGVPVIEDCCQSLGAPAGGEPTGTAGEVAILSFHATKCLAAGEGGMLVSGNRELIETARALRSRNAVASPLSDLQAALASSQLERYGSFLERRAALAAHYMDRLPEAWTVRTREVAARSMFFRFPATPDTGSFAAWRQHFEQRGIAVRRGVDALLHRVGAAAGSFPGAEDCFARTLSLPLYPALSDAEAERIVEAAREWTGAS